MRSRQGDIIIQKIDKIPASAKLKRGGVILYGEATGHKHALVNGDVLQDGDKIYLQVKKGGKVVHEEHSTIGLTKGSYIILRTREYDYSSRSERLVQD